MRRIIDRKMYDTETAEDLAHVGSNEGYSDFRYWEDRLYRTQRGNFFLACEGGPLSRYSEPVGDGVSSGSSFIRPLSPDEAVEWLEENAPEVFADMFPHLISFA